jgi:conserved domain protein
MSRVQSVITKEMNTMAGVTPSIMECRNYSVQDIMNIYGVGEESVRNFIKKHQKNNDFRVFMVGKYLRIDKNSFEDWYNNHPNEF